MQYIRLQVGCFVVVLYILFEYMREIRYLKEKHRFSLFDAMLIITLIFIVFDGVTAYTVNHLLEVPLWINQYAHLIFLLLIDSLIYLFFIYMLTVTESYPKKEKARFLLSLPFIINMVILIANIHSLEYIQGTITNYSMGISVYTCYGMVAIYVLFTIITFIGRWNYIERRKRESIMLYLGVLIILTTYQMIKPEVLLTSLGFTILIVGIYMNQENPTLKELENYQNEMIMGFATLVEQRDDSTGGHIRRTSLYVELIAKELRNRGYYRSVLTKDYIQNLITSAPMHDMGKIAIPDAILQKPGRLTEEEYEVMKSHAKCGGEIIKETFGKIEDEEYMEMAYNMATYHHEKWNGKGYPFGLKEQEIPLCARIMAIADVFDAVSEKRCYRDALPLEQCFQIIAEGRGTDFEPLLVDLFLECKDKVIRVHKNTQKENKKTI